MGALPSRLGFGAMQAAIEARRPLVDVSFTSEDPLALDGDARRAGVAIFPDCGLAPGLTHLCAAHATMVGTPDEITMYVGGVAQDRTRPYGYVVTWSIEDLLEEYVRPARVVRTHMPRFGTSVRPSRDGCARLPDVLALYRHAQGGC